MHAFRKWRTHRSLIATVLLTIALGIGANTAIFSVVYATLIAPLPYRNPEQLVSIYSQRNGERAGVSFGDFTDWRQQTRAFSELNARVDDDFNIAAGNHLEYVRGMDVTTGYNQMLGNPLLLGRSFLPEEGTPGKEHVAILTHRLWQRLGANRKVIGQTMRINGDLYTVVGVLAPGSMDRRDEQLMMPLALKPADRNDYDGRWLALIGRLKSGVTLQQAQAEMNTVSARNAENHPNTDKGWGALVTPLRNDNMPSERQRTLWLLLGATGFLLLIACVNVANLLLASGLARQREVAIRISLGAKPAVIFRQFLSESLAFSVVGGVLGVAVGYVLLRILTFAIPAHILPPEADLRLNIPILLIMLSVAAMSGLLFGCVPAWYAARVDPAHVMKDGARAGMGTGRHRIRRSLAVAQFALSLTLLAGAGLALRSLWNLTHLDLGLRTDHTFAFYLIPQSLPADSKQTSINSYYRSILASIEAVPGVSHATAMTWLPLEGLGIQVPFEIAGQPPSPDPGSRPMADYQMAAPDYFQTLGIPIVKGRPFNAHDDPSSTRVVMVNEAFVSKFLRGVDPLQQSVVMEQRKPGEPALGPAIAHQIIGVFHNVKTRRSREDFPQIVVAFWQEGSLYAGIAVRTSQQPAAMASSIEAAVHKVDSQVPLAEPRTMEQVRDDVWLTDRFTAILFATFAALALLLATLGIYSLMAFSVTGRSQEIALRLVVGATPNQVLALVMKDGLTLACTGLAFGALGAYFVGRTMQSILFQVGAIDFPAFATVGLLLLLAALLATYLPALKAASTEMMETLRRE